MGHTGHLKIVHKVPQAKRSPVAEAEAVARELGVTSALRKRADEIPEHCTKNGFYLHPTRDTVYTVAPKPAESDSLLIAWDPACLPNTPAVDIWLFTSTGQRIWTWTGVSNAAQKNAPKLKSGDADQYKGKGYTEVKILPRWWNTTASVGGPEERTSLQIKIMKEGLLPFRAQLGATSFTASYTPPSSGDLPKEADLNAIDIAVTEQPKGPSKGGIAAAVLLPLIAIGLAIGVWIRWKRGKEVEKRQEWKEEVDKRMSMVSTDWKAVTHKGAQAAIRNSMAVSRNSMAARQSVFGEGVYGSEAGHSDIDVNQRRPGVGLRNPGALTGERQSRISFAATTGGDRQSRVSFAESGRPSVDSRRTKNFRDSFVPPVPALPATSPLARDDDESRTSSDAEGTMSPTQAAGAMTLTPEAIRARIAAGRARSASKSSPAHKTGEQDVTEYDEVMPALALMRTGHPNAASSDDLLFSVPSPTAPAPTLAYPKLNSETPASPTTNNPYANMISPVTSPVMASIPMPLQPASVMSPDDMLRAYAERKKSMASGSVAISNPMPFSSTAAISYPAPAATTSGSGNTRALYQGGVVSPQGTGEGEKKGRTPSLGFAPGEYDADFVFKTEAGK